MTQDINLEFQIVPTHDPKKLIIVDTSIWSLIKDKPAIIEIILPGESHPITHYFDKNQVNVFNSINLGYNCSPHKSSDYLNLPDGIYQITIKGSPDSFSFSRDYLKSDSTQLEFDKFVNSNNLLCNDISDEIMSKINAIQNHLSFADSNARVGDFCQAQEHLFKAQKLITKLKGCRTCV